MVRYKKRYFVIQLDRHSDVANELKQHQQLENDAEPQKKKKKLDFASRKRSLCDPKPLDFNDSHLSNAVKDIVTQIHGDFGRAAVTIGLRTIYCNPETRLCLVQCRHGPHRLVASSLPFLSKIGNEERLIPRLIYTGATIRNCYKRMEIYQRQELESALKEFGEGDENEKIIYEEKILKLRNMN